MNINNNTLMNDSEEYEGYLLSGFCKRLFD